MSLVFRTTVFSKQVRLFLRSRRRPVCREELYEAFGDDPATRKRIKSALANLIDNGHVKRTQDGCYEYVSTKPIPGEAADRVWEYWRQSQEFTARECAKYTEVDISYVKYLIRLYRKRGYVKLVPAEYVNHDERHYRLIEGQLIRPMPGETSA